MSHSSTARAGGRSRSLILTAMIFAVAMTFIDQTIVSIAAPTIQHNLGLSSSGMQWAINAYLLTLAALFAFGGRLADIAGHRKMVVLGVIIFAAASALCGATPRGSAAEARQAGLTLRETVLVIFGSPQAGTPVMAASPLAALDLPLKV